MTIIMAKTIYYIAQLQSHGQVVGHFVIHFNVILSLQESHVWASRAVYSFCGTRQFIV